MFYSDIYIKEEVYKDYEIENNSDFISNLSRLNIFIGTNNSGKSRFLKGIFSNPKAKVLYKDIDTKKINEWILFYKHQIEVFFNKHIENDYGNVLANIREIKEFTYLSNEVQFNNSLFDKIQKVQRINTSSSLGLKTSYDERGNRISHEYVVEFCKRETNFFLNKIIEFGIDASFKLPLYESVYIPMLRGLRPITGSGTNDNFSTTDNSYLNRTKRDYFKELNHIDYKIFTGLSIYEEIKSLLLSAERNKVKKFENFLSISFFNGKVVNLVPHISDDSLHIKIGEEEFPIYNLGDGIQAIIILTYPLFFNIGKNLKVFIEEPEVHLHPGLQRILVETLLKPEFKTYQYFLTTHSNHFLDLTLDLDNISIYSFRKEINNSSSKFIISNVENDNSEILSLIGVRNSSVFLSNCTIWVEGITDRIYLRKYLDLIQKEKTVKFKEDTHYSFVEYGGNNITHWSFLDDEDAEHSNINVERLCSKLLLVTDNDGAGQKEDGSVQKGKEKKNARFKKLKETLGDRYILLSVKEIENLLIPDILSKVISSYGKEEALDFSKVSFEKYKNASLGKYINDRVIGITRDYATDSGSIKDKVKFAKKAVENIFSINDISEEAKQLAESVYNFIKSNNE